MQDLLLMIVLLGSLAGSNAFLLPSQKMNHELVAFDSMLHKQRSTNNNPLITSNSWRNKAMVKRSERIFALALARREATPPQGGSSKSTLQKNNEEDSEDDDEEEYEEEEIDLDAEYDALAKKDGKVTVFSLTKWKEMKELFDDEVLTKEELYEIVADALERNGPITDKEAKTLTLSKDQFMDVIEGVDQLTMGDEDEEYEDDEDDDEEYDEERAAEIRKDREELWKRLLKKPGDETIKAADLKRDEEIQEFFEDGSLDDEVWKELIQSVLGEKTNVNTAKLTFEEFDEVVDQIAGLLDEEEEYDDDEDDDYEDEEEEEEGEVIDTEAREVSPPPPPPSSTKKPAAKNNPVTNNRPPTKSSKK